MCAAFTLKCLAYEVYVLGSNEQSYLSSLLFSSHPPTTCIFAGLAARRTRIPDPDDDDGPARPRPSATTRHNFFHSLFLLSRQTGLKQQRLCATPPTTKSQYPQASFRPHSRALQFQYFITAVECYRNSLESDRAPFAFTAPSTVLHRDRASRSNGTIPPLSGK